VSQAERARNAGQLRIRSERRSNVHDVGLAGELDLATADALHDELTAVEATDADQIILDLAGLDFIDSTGLRLILTADARCNADGNRLTLLRGPPHVQRIFEITATADRLPFADR
jgi:anti-anti-sigma factor